MSASQLRSLYLPSILALYIMSQYIYPLSLCPLIPPSFPPSFVLFSHLPFLPRLLINPDCSDPPSHTHTLSTSRILNQAQRIRINQLTWKKSMGRVKAGCLQMLGVHFDGAKETYRELEMRYFITYSQRQKMRENKQFSRQLIYLASIALFRMLWPRVGILTRVQNKHLKL